MTLTFAVVQVWWIRKVWNKIMAWTPCFQWCSVTSLSAKLDCKTSSSAVRGTRRHQPRWSVCNLWSAQNQSSSSSCDTSSRSTRRFCILRELNHTIFEERLVGVKVVLVVSYKEEGQAKNWRQFETDISVDFQIFVITTFVPLISKWKIYLKVTSSWG